jgi:hypothetical protein
LRGGPWTNTVIRPLRYADLEFRTYATNLTVNATNATTDARHNQKLRVSARDEPNQRAHQRSEPRSDRRGNINWGNVDSWFGDTAGERTIDTLGMLTVETKWSQNVTTQFAIGYKDFYNQLFTESHLRTARAGRRQQHDRRPGQSAPPAPASSGTSNPAAHSRAFSRCAFDSDSVPPPRQGPDHRRRRLPPDAETRSSITTTSRRRQLQPGAERPGHLRQQRRTNMPAIVWPMTTLSEHPFPGWSPGLEKLTYQGRNYLLMQSNPANVFPRTGTTARRHAWWQQLQYR